MRSNVLYFKSPRVESEWPVLHPALRAMLWGLAEFSSFSLGKRLTITCLHRTPEENAAAGGKPTSLHLVDRAADIRLHGLAQSQVRDLCEEFVKMRASSKLTFLVEGAGTPNEHLHVQYKV